MAISEQDILKLNSKPLSELTNNIKDYEAYKKSFSPEEYDVKTTKLKKEFVNKIHSSVAYYESRVSLFKHTLENFEDIFVLESKKNNLEKDFKKISILGQEIIDFSQACIDHDIVNFMPELSKIDFSSVFTNQIKLIAKKRDENYVSQLEENPTETRLNALIKKLNEEKEKYTNYYTSLNDEEIKNALLEKMKDLDNQIIALKVLTFFNTNNDSKESPEPPKFSPKEKVIDKQDTATVIESPIAVQPTHSKVKQVLFMNFISAELIDLEKNLRAELTTAELEEKITAFKRLQKQTSNDELAKINLTSDEQQKIKQQLADFELQLLNTIEAFIINRGYTPHKNTIHKEFELLLKKYQKDIQQLNQQRIDSLNSDIDKLLSNNNETKNLFNTFINCLPESIKDQLQAQIDQTNIELNDSVVVNNQQTIHTRRTVAFAYIDELTKYIGDRHNEYKFKDFFLSKDKENRVELVTDLKAMLLQYILDESKAKDIRIYLQTHKNNFPGKKLKPILNRLYLALGEEEQPKNSTQVIKNADINNAYSILLNEIRDLHRYSQSKLDKEDRQVVVELCNKLKTKLVNFKINKVLDGNKVISGQDISRFRQEFNTVLHSQDDKMLNHRDTGFCRGLVNIAAGLTGFILALRLFYTKFISDDKRCMLFGAKTERLNKVAEIDNALDFFVETIK